MLDFRDDSNRAKYFVSTSVPYLYNMLNEHLRDIINPSDRYSGLFLVNWHYFVSFVLFVLRCRHVQTDRLAYQLLCMAIEDYLRGNALGVDTEGMLVHDDQSNYINYFGLGCSYTIEERERIKQTSKLYNELISTWNRNCNNRPFIHSESRFEEAFIFETRRPKSSSSADYLLNFSHNKETPDFSGSFRILFDEYSLNGDSNTIKLFNCRRTESDKARFYDKRIEGFKID